MTTTSRLSPRNLCLLLRDSINSGMILVNIIPVSNHIRTGLTIGIDYLSYAYTYDIQTWISSAFGSVYSSYGFTDCDGICGVNAPNPGYTATCDWTQEDVDFIADLNFGNVTNTTSPQTIETDLMSVNFTLNFATLEKNYTWIGVNMINYVPVDLNTSDSNSICPAQLFRTQCELRQSIINYPVYMQFSNQSTTSRHGAVSKVDVYLGGLNKFNGTRDDLQEFDYDLGQLPGFDWISDVVTNNRTPAPSPSPQTAASTKLSKTDIPRAPTSPRTPTTQHLGLSPFQDRKLPCWQTTNTHL